MVLRKTGLTTVKCPYCGTIHDHGPQPGYHVPDCADDDNGAGIVIEGRSFIARYGYMVMEYEEADE